MVQSTLRVNRIKHLKVPVTQIIHPAKKNKYHNKTELCQYKCLHLWLVACSMFHPITFSKPTKRLNYGM